MAVALALAVTGAVTETALVLVLLAAVVVVAASLGALVEAEEGPQEEREAVVEMPVVEVVGGGPVE